MHPRQDAPFFQNKVVDWGKQDTQETQDQLTTGSLLNSSVQLNLVPKINNLTIPLPEQ